ncbi:Casein kinase 1-like protein HD16 [Vitis vinifera]|uniref:Casein kinase 1-like protein HD16 n=1 Tax=Vitis vinifera TaxID=29760 RepID=A0A438JV56_VITVI|nr:Casein kinase 1-like protein HD16 [Vitis vinifera]
MATAGSRWGVVMSRNAGFSDQVVELDFLYPSEGIHRRWDSGYRITSTAATWDQSALILSVPKRKPGDETQETLRTSQFPSTHVKVNDKWIHTLQNIFIPDLKNGQRISILPACAMDELYLDYPLNCSERKKLCRRLSLLSIVCFLHVNCKNWFYMKAADINELMFDKSKMLAGHA